MLTIYEDGTCNNRIGREPVIDFDDFFDTHIGEIVVDDTVKRVMAYIDEAEFIGSNQIKNRFNDPTDIRNISRGAKAVICVYTFPMVVFDFSYCQNNAISCMFTLPRGRVVLEISEHGKPYDKCDVFNRIRVVTWEGTRICESVFRAYHYLSWCRVNLQEDDISLYEYECRKHCFRLDEDLDVYVPMSYSQYEYEQLTQKLRRRELLELDKIQYPGYNSRLPGYMCGGKGMKNYSMLERRIRKKYEKEVSRRERARQGFTGERTSK